MAEASLEKNSVSFTAKAAGAAKATGANYGDDDPIAAFATTPGGSALTLIRCSGKGSIELINSIFTSLLNKKNNPVKKPLDEKLPGAAGNTIIHGWIISGGEKIDEVLVSVFRAPKSYTGEDSIDICCHGGISAGKAVMAALKDAGFRDALPGEFTFRAFMNGKLDLTRCESVMELVSAKTEKGRSRAVSRLSGSLEKEINEIKNRLVQVLAAAEIYLDYSEDEISADNIEEIEGSLPGRETAQDALARLKKLSASWQAERIFQEGLTLVIAGRPNAGKSSLFNLLLKEDRSIVTEIPGTTRDWIEAWISINGIPVRLVDTAGLRETSDSVEKIGVNRSLNLLNEADLVLYLIDGESGITAEDLKYAGCCCLYVWNKSDIALPPQPFPVKNIAPVCVSAKTGEGISGLYAAITAAVERKAACDFQTGNDGFVALGTERQKKLVDAACRALDEALAMSESKSPLDIIAPLLREAVNSLGEITGEVSTADILEEMFSRFCVGK
ncbi:MAG: tRNA uridine-5-carboxymethylaminomethyl(34) synthesis GTPase MnmE [Treponema sp.]|nr:tRNA uridine-5-carboxymethylaminomethyl(34) synthesis GTPase MnmE [Treponema sp.]